MTCLSHSILSSRNRSRRSLVDGLQQYAPAVGAAIGKGGPSSRPAFPPALGFASSSNIRAFGRVRRTWNAADRPASPAPTTMTSKFRCSTTGKTPWWPSQPPARNTRSRPKVSRRSLQPVRDLEGGRQIAASERPRAAADRAIADTFCGSHCQGLKWYQFADCAGARGQQQAVQQIAPRDFSPTKRLTEVQEPSGHGLIPKVRSP